MDVFEWVTIGFVSVIGVLLIVSQYRRAKEYMDNIDDWDSDDDDDLLW